MHEISLSFCTRIDRLGTKEPSGQASKVSARHRRSPSRAHKQGRLAHQSRLVGDSQSLAWTGVQGGPIAPRTDGE
jgi:hypothetical protein